MILLFISDRLGRLQETYEEKSKEINDVLERLSWREKNGYEN